jgi:hypothetical protein
MEVGILAKPLQQGRTGGIGVSDGPLPAGATVDVTPSSFSIEPGRMAVARIVVQSAPAAKGDTWFGLALSERGNAKSLAETVFGTLTVKGTEAPRLEVVKQGLDSLQGHPVRIRFTVRNTGNQAVQPEASCTVLRGGVLREAALEVPKVGDGGILPGAEIDNSVMLPQDLKPGDYIVDIGYQYTDKDSAHLRVPITVPGAKPAAKKPAKPVRKPVKTR